MTEPTRDVVLSIVFGARDGWEYGVDDEGDFVVWTPPKLHGTTYTYWAPADLVRSFPLGPIVFAELVESGTMKELRRTVAASN